MRFNKTNLALFLSTLLTASVTAQSLQAKTTDQSADKARSAKSAKNDGRKLSMTFPGVVSANITVAPALVKPLAVGKPLASGRNLSLPCPILRGSAGKRDCSIETGDNNITVKLPPSIESAIDDAQVLGRQISQTARKGAVGANHLINLVLLYLKQWTGTATVTPGGYPYVEKSSFDPGPNAIAASHKLYFTGEGRLKSVVSR